MLCDYSDLILCGYAFAIFRQHIYIYIYMCVCVCIRNEDDKVTI